MKNQLVAEEIFKNNDLLKKKQELTAKINSYLQAKLADLLKG